MKLTKKLPLCSVALTALAIILCCTILLVTTANNLIDGAVKSGITELKMLNNAFNAEMEAMADENPSLSETTKRALILFVFRKYTDTSVSGSGYVLTDTAKALYNESPIDPVPLLPKPKAGSGEAGYRADGENDAVLWPGVIAQLDGEMYVVAGHWDDHFGDLSFKHGIFLIRNVTDIYRGIAAMALRFAGVAFVSVVLSALLMIGLTRRMLRPLQYLRNSAAALANGQYDSRITVTGRDEIAALAKSFNTMADAIVGHIEALEETAEQRMLLLGALTHELKTPMTAIIGYSEALMRVRLSKVQQEESVRYIHSECKRIERLAQKMMQLIALHGGQPVELMLMPAQTLFAAVEKTLRPIAKECGLELRLDTDEPCEFVMDIDMMASVLINLFDNARKAGAKHIDMTAKNGSLCVSDNGSGIEPNDLKKVKQPFYMADKSHSRSEGGSGLGLTICEMIAAAHHAALHIESEVGKGTTVFISFNKLHVDNSMKNT